MAGPSCYRIYEQLQRINDPGQHNGEGVPFEMPEECLPNRENIRRRYVEGYCGVECMNNGVHAGRRYGEPEAMYGPGSERIGVGVSCSPKWLILDRRC